MSIAIIVEGKTETAFKKPLIEFLKPRLAGKMPKLDFVPYHHRVPKGEKLKQDVQRLLNGSDAADHVLALTDIFTGGGDFKDATDAKQKMLSWVESEPRFTPHVALFEFEAWLLPYWSEIRKLSRTNRAAPSSHPEAVNHGKPPSKRISDAFANGTQSRGCVNVRDATGILRNADLSVSIRICSELKAFVNSILRLSGGAEMI